MALKIQIKSIFGRQFPLTRNSMFALTFGLWIIIRGRKYMWDSPNLAKKQGHSIPQGAFKTEFDMAKSLCEKCPQIQLPCNGVIGKTFSISFYSI